MRQAPQNEHPQLAPHPLGGGGEVGLEVTKRFGMGGLSLLEVGIAPFSCLTPPPPCDIPSGCCSFKGTWTFTRSSLRMLRQIAAFCRPLRPVLQLVLFPRSRSPVVGVLALC